MIPIDISLDNRRFNVDGVTLSAHQPEFMPWLGYVSKATMADVYFILDSVQYVKDVFQNRNKIRIKQGDGWQWLNIPVKRVGNHILNWKDVRIDNNQNWKSKWRSDTRNFREGTIFVSMILNPLIRTVATASHPISR